MFAEMDKIIADFDTAIADAGFVLPEVQAPEEERWKAALKDLRKAGVKVRQNVQKCCRGCIVEEDLGMGKDSAQPYAYSYGGQGQAYCWEDGLAYNRADLRKAKNNWYGDTSSARETSIYWNWGNGSGQAIKDAFEAHGFEVDWDGSDHKCVVVKLGMPS